MADPAARHAARLATLVALPVALLVGVGAFWLFGRHSAAPTGAGPSARPRATASVTMPAAALSGQAATVCRALVSQLPDTVRDLARRPVGAGTEQNAAWGDPPLTLACGVPPDAVGQTDFLPSLNGVCWHTRPVPGGTAWTTVDRQVPVTVTVPGQYTSPGAWVQEFTSAVTASVPSAATKPTGCSG
jgi:hypothetical protein